MWNKIKKLLEKTGSFIMDHYNVTVFVLFVLTVWGIMRFLYLTDSISKS